MSDTANKAVFLSYASQDAEAAKRICDALRAAGVEVWFDQSELVGGDQWDQKIRRQIKECALLIPIISQNTQARAEGYFRLEWLLAVERARLMADDHPFLLPVVIDDTPDATARVPEKFRDVQWTRLPGGETPEKFCERVGRLVGGEEASGQRQEARGHGSEEQPIQTTGREARATKKGRPWLVPALIGVVAVAALAVWQPWKKSASPTPPGPVAPAPSVAKSPAAAPADPSLVVLPFEGRTDGKEDAYLADGIHEDIVTTFASVRGLKVTSRASALRFRKTNKPPRQIGQELGVAYLLTGSVRREGNQVRVTAELVDTTSEQQVWAKSFDREVANVLTLQRELAAEIVPALHLVLRPEEKVALTRGPTASGSAYELFLQARALKKNKLYQSQADAQRAETLLRQAVAEDGSFVRAWTEIAQIQVDLFTTSPGEAGGPRIAAAEEAITAARRLAPEAPEVMLAAGRVRHYMFQDYPAAMFLYRQIVASHPNYPDVRVPLALLYRRLGQWPEALAELRLAVRQEPGNGWARGSLFMTNLWVRRYDEVAAMLNNPTIFPRDTMDGAYIRAVADLRRSGKKDGFDQWIASLPVERRESPEVVTLRIRWAMAVGDSATVLDLVSKHGLPEDEIAAGFAFALADRREELGQLLAPAKAQTARLVAANGEDGHVWRDRAKYHALMGEKPEALAAVEKARQLAPESRDAVNGPMLSVELAKVLVWVGEKDKALTELERLAKIPATFHVFQLKHSLDWLPLRGEPRFQALIDDPANLRPLIPDP